MLISQHHNSVSKNYTGAICLNTIQNFPSLHNDSVKTKLPPYLVMERVFKEVMVFKKVFPSETGLKAVPFFRMALPSRFYCYHYNC